MISRVFRLVPLVLAASFIGGAFSAVAQVDDRNGALGVPAFGDAPPPAVGQTGLPPAPKAVQGMSEEPAPSTVGLAQPGRDGSTVIVKPRPTASPRTKRTAYRPASEFQLAERGGTTRLHEGMRARLEYQGPFGFGYIDQTGLMKLSRQF
jgi:hypothetical protein